MSETRTAEVADDLHDRPIDLLRELVRFDTTNPPGNERACLEWVADVLDEYGIDSELYAADPDRPNLYARIPGGEAPALMCYGHVDVVPANADAWQHGPFEGALADDCVWGRGALDMKGGVAMFLSAYLRAAVADDEPAGDLVFCLVSDEEGGGDEGAAFLVEEYPHLFDDVEYALGEFGGFSMDLAGERFYPIQIAEKAVCWLDVTFSGQGGHGSMPHEGGALAKMARSIAALDGVRLPVHVTPEAEAMIEGVADGLEPPTSEYVRGLLDPDRTDEILDELGDEAETFDAILHNTANVTAVDCDGKENVVPGRARMTIDCRLVPGQTPDDVIAELREYVHEDAEFEVRRFEPAPERADLGLFETLAAVLEDADPSGSAIPMLLTGGTDGRHFAKVGVQSYGFTPMRLPESFEFMSYVHAADERIPVEALEFGADAVYEAVRRYDC